MEVIICVTFIVVVLGIIIYKMSASAQQRREEMEKIKIAAFMFTMMNTKDEFRMAAAVHDIVGKGSPTADRSKPDYNQKSESRANANRVKGNAVMNSAPEQALKLYNESIAFAPEKSTALPFGYANRAVVLAALGYNFDAIADNQRALKSGYPEDLQYKVFARLGKCYEKVGQYGRSLTCLNAALEGLNNSVLSEEAKKKFQAEHIQPTLDACHTAGEEDEEDLKDWTDEPLIGVDKVEVPSLSNPGNTELISASSSVALKYNKKFGRHLVATKDIEIGEIVMIEDPYAAFVIPQKFHRNCSHCFKTSRTLQPCSVCSWAMFCSSACKAEAEPYHKLECLYFLSALHHAMNTSVDEHLVAGYMLGVRIITRYGIEAITKYPNPAFEKVDVKTDEGKRTAGFNKDGKYDPSDLRTIVNLCHHPIEDSVTILRYCYSIAKIMSLMKFNTDGRFIKLGKVLYRFITNSGVNGSCNMVEWNLHIEDREVIAMGMYPTYALMNQSCIQNVYATFHGKTMVVRAYKNIKKGEQLFVTKGFNTFVTVPRDARRLVNKERYHFTCTCRACEENWPIQDDLPLMPHFLPTGGQFFETLKNSHNQLVKLCTVDKDMHIIVNAKTLPLLKNYLKLLESKKLTLCGFYLSVLNWVMLYYFKQGSHVGIVDDPEVPNIEERLTPQFVHKAMLSFFSK